MGGDGEFDAVQVVGDGDKAGVVAAPTGGVVVDAVQVGARGCESWNDGVGHVVFGGEEQHVSWLCKAATLVGHGGAGADAGCEVARDQGFTYSWVAV